MKGHNFGAWISRVGWLRYCDRCGLIALKNARTQAAIKAGCKGSEE